MRLTPSVYLVGSGYSGFYLSGALDCHVYLLDGGSELALVDTGLGIDGALDKILENIRADGHDPRRIRKLILTHYHADHAAAAAALRDRLDLEVIASHIAAPVLRDADERAISLDVARAAGFYPADFRMQPCPVDQAVGEGDTIDVGALRLRVYETPGHCAGHLSFHMQDEQRSTLIGGDLVFWGGRICLQNIHDCHIDAYAASVFKMEGLPVDVLLPGHLQISLQHGKDHVDKTAAAFRNLAVPPNIF